MIPILPEQSRSNMLHVADAALYYHTRATFKVALLQSYQRAHTHTYIYSIHKHYCKLIIYQPTCTHTHLLYSIHKFSGLEATIVINKLTQEIVQCTISCGQIQVDDHANRHWKQLTTTQSAMLSKHFAVATSCVCGLV